MAKQTAKNKLRSAFLWVHRWLGLISGIVVFVVALTGTLYVFEEEGRDIFQHKYFYVTPAATPKKPLQEISAAVKKVYPKETITQIRFREQADAAIVYHTKSEKAISVNPYTLQIIGARNLKHDFFSTVLDIHLHLLMGKTGAQIVKWNVLIFFIMCITGLIIWWPKQKRFFKQAISIKFKAKSWKRVNWDLHSVLGFYALFVLLIISFTGMFWVFDSVKSLVSTVTGSPITKNEKTVSTFIKNSSEYPVEAAYYTASAMEPGAAQVFITNNPGDSLAPIRVLFRYPYAIVRKQNTLFFDKYTGKLLRADLFRNYTAYDNVSRSNYDFHTGRIRVLGIGSKIIYFLSGLFAASLPVTGFLIWWGRRKKKPAATVQSGKKIIIKEPALQKA